MDHDYEERRRARPNPCKEGTALELNALRLKEHATETARVFEFLEPETSRLAGFADFETARPWQPSRFQLWQQSMFDRHRWLVVGLALFAALIFLPIFLLSILLRRKLSSRERPRLILKDAVGESIVLSVRQSSGMFYDSRDVHDSEGHAIAQFRGPSKIALGRMSFGIIDLSRKNQDVKD